MAIVDLIKSKKEKEKDVELPVDVLPAIASWREALQLPKATVSKGFLHAVENQVITFNVDTFEFTVKLRRPLVLENNEKINFLTVREPVTKEITDASKGRDVQREEMAIGENLLSVITGKPVGVIQRLPAHELALLGECLGFFN